MDIGKTVQTLLSTNVFAQKWNIGPKWDNVQKVTSTVFEVDNKDLTLTVNVILMSLSTLNTFDPSVYRFHVELKIAFS